MPFNVKKDSGIIPKVLTTILDECVNGVTLADPDLEDCPIVYANKAFERLSGYGQEEIIGVNCRFLQGSDRNQDARQTIKEGIANHEEVEVTLRNYRKDGSLFHNHLKITPILDSKNRVLYFLGVQYDVTYRVEAENEIKRLGDLLK
jgi:PAS domain S-box-containing protein